MSIFFISMLQNVPANSFHASHKLKQLPRNCIVIISNDHKVLVYKSMNAQRRCVYLWFTGAETGYHNYDNGTILVLLF